jgi:cell division protein FtsB
MPRRYTVTARAAMLAVAVGVVVLALALPLKVFLSQQATVSQLQTQTSSEAAQVAALRAALREWSDRSYVEAQARDRLHLVLPGQTSYLVLGGPAVTAAPSGPASHVVAASRAWYSQLWTSISAAGRAGSGQQAASPRG